MEKFEVGGIYKGVDDDIEIEVLERTDKTITFKFTNPNWYEMDTEQIYRREATAGFSDFEIIFLEIHGPFPLVQANEKVN